jgi:GT2 family glycosyltransferase
MDSAMQSRPDVSVVVSTCDRPERLGRLLEALRGQRYPLERFEVVIVDDASGPATGDVLGSAAAEDGLRLRALRRPSRGGPARARDQGWRAAEAELIAFTDDDCEPDPGWLEAGVSAARAQPGAIVQGETRPIPREEHLLGPFSRTIRVTSPDPGFQCCNVFYPRSVLEAVNGFDVATFRRWGGEDADLGWRALEAGAPAAFAPEARVFHAVNQLGPVGKLRHSWRWSMAMAAYARHSGLRRAHFFGGFFWKATHYWFARAVLAAIIPVRRNALRNWLLFPYLRSLYARAKQHRNPLLVAFYFIDDLVEVAAVLRGAVRFRRPML